MKMSRSADFARTVRRRTLIEDPIRLACLGAAAALVFLPSVSFLATLLILGVIQLAPAAMLARSMDRGWSRRWGWNTHESVFASSLAMDFTSLAACSVVGALLLVRHFNGMEIVRPLGILAAAVCFLPEIRPCRWLLAGEPVEASRQLREGYSLRDPVMLGAILTAGAVCLIDRTSLQFLMLSVAVLQVNTMLVLIDKYLPEIEARRHTSVKALLFEREGRRFVYCLAPLAIIPLRFFLGDMAGYVGAGAIVAGILAADLVRLIRAAFFGTARLLRVTPIEPGPTLIVLPRM